MLDHFVFIQMGGRRQQDPRFCEGLLALQEAAALWVQNEIRLSLSLSLSEYLDNAGNFRGMGNGVDRKDDLLWEILVLHIL